jgi:hypothetical protein
MTLSIVGLCFAAVIGLYYYNNPLGHGSWFMTRRFINWFPLGMTVIPSHVVAHGRAPERRGLNAS